MIKHAQPQHPISELIRKRWSPYGFADRAVPDEDLRAMFEAARWAPSSYNAQPWHYIVGIAGDDVFPRILRCLIDANQKWARLAPVLALGIVDNRFAHNDKPNSAAEHDLGLASAHLTFEATARGISVHQMIGIHNSAIREEFSLPESVRPLTALAIGYAGDSEELADTLRARDVLPRERHTLAQFVHGGVWGKPAAFLR